MNAAETYANLITVDVVANGTDEDNKGKTLGDLRMIGTLPATAELDDNYAALIVRTVDGVTKVSRSTTDEVLVSARGFTKAMEALAAMFDLPVRVAADYGVSGGQVSKVVGTYGEQFTKVTEVTACTLTDECAVCLSGSVCVARCTVCGGTNTDPCPVHDVTQAEQISPVITIPVGTSECACQGIWQARQAGEVLPVGGLCCPSDGSLFVLTDTEPSETVAAASSQVVDANARIKRAEYDAHVIPTNTPAVDGYEWKRHVLPGREVWAGSTYQLIVAGSNCQVMATVKHVADGRWHAQGCSWGNPTLTEDYWAGESLEEAFANVVKYADFLARAKVAGLNGHELFRADWRTWVAPTLPAPLTDHDMRDQVIECLGGWVADFDVPWIMDRIQAEFGTVDVKTIEPKIFWEIVRVHGSRDLIRGGDVVRILTGRTPAISNLDIITDHDEAWQRAEDTIWAGTDQVVKMRFPRKLKKVLRQTHWHPVIRPIDRKRARVLAGR